METRRARTRLAWLLAPIFILLALSLSAATSARATTPLDDCTGPVAGKHIYDCAHLLTPTEVTTLEADAAAVDRAGAPTIVYLQVRDATAQQTFQDAVDLMGRWNVESKPGAHDGFVMFFDLQAGNLHHGTVALFAGAKHYQHGNLPQKELDRIRTDVMTPLLANEQTAAGIAAGLQMVAHDLRYGPPPPPAYQTVASTLGRIPFNALGLLFAAVVAFLFYRLTRQPPLSSAGDDVGLGSLAAPGDLPPAQAGALVTGRISDAQMEATILDFARRGLLVIEPTGATSVQVRLVGDGKELVGYERDLWSDLEGYATGEQRTIPSAQLAEVRRDWSATKAQLRRDLIERGWYDPEAAARRRRPLYAAGAIGMVGALVAVILLIMSQEGWAAFGLVIFLGVGIAAFVRAYFVPATTVEGELAAAPWRGYAASVSDHAYQPKLDTDLPYIVGLGLISRLAPRLKAASENGYSPSWFRMREGQRVPTTGFYPYFFIFHSSMSPVSSSTQGGGSYGGGFSGGGAAGGGGGSAGSF